MSFLDTSQRFGINVNQTDIGKPDKVSKNAAKWSSARGYNKNLVLLLKDMENDGLICIHVEKVNLFGDNPFNPTTMIAWHNA